MKPLIYFCLTHILENRQKLVLASIPGEIIENYIYKKIQKNKVFDFNLPAANGINSVTWQTAEHILDICRHTDHFLNFQKFYAYIIFHDYFLVTFFRVDILDFEMRPAILILI